MSQNNLHYSPPSKTRWRPGLFKFSTEKKRSLMNEIAVPNNTEEAMKVAIKICISFTF